MKKMLNTSPGSKATVENLITSKIYKNNKKKYRNLMIGIESV